MQLETPPYPNPAMKEVKESISGRVVLIIVSKFIYIYLYKDFRFVLNYTINLLFQFVQMENIHQAVKDEDISLVRTLIASGANVNEQDSSRRTPLHLAAWRGNTEIVQLLLRADANTKIQGLHKLQSIIVHVMICSVVLVSAFGSMSSL